MFGSFAVLQDSLPATFSVLSAATVVGNNKSMISIANTTGSSVKIKIKEIYIINSQTTAVTGVIAQFNLFKFTSHTGGTLLTVVPHDSQDALNGSVTSRTGATIAGESTTPLRTFRYSTDEWGVGTLDVEGNDHITQTHTPVYRVTQGTKPFVINANEGITLKCITNTTAGSFDILVVFTQE